jgi:hypothetical protein
MLSSLFGELESSKPSDGRSSRASAPAEPGDQGFAATAILETVISDLNESGHLVDRHQHDLVVSGSAALAIREHFAATRSDLETASRLITLIDPSGVWAAEVVRALSDAGGRPLDRLHLREQATLRTLATIERTTLVRRHEETLKIYRAAARGRCLARQPARGLRFANLALPEFAVHGAAGCQQHDAPHQRGGVASERECSCD